MKRIYHFLGSVKCALILIALAAIFVIAGTFIESAYDSHQFASSVIYSSPPFLFLLAGFFVNILVAALRRWPFKKRHIPFLVTHLGLLMLIAGTAVKITYGIQGRVVIPEGGSKDSILLSDTQVLYLEGRDQKGWKTFPVRKEQTAPHSLEKVHSWVFQNQVYLIGHPPISLPVNGKTITLDETPPFTLYAEKNDQASESAEKLYRQLTTVSIRNPYSLAILWEGSLESFLQSSHSVGTHTLYGSLDWESQKLIVGADQQKKWVEVSLAGKDALTNRNLIAPAGFQAPFQVDLKAPLSVVMIEDPEYVVHHFIFGPYGRVLRSRFPAVTPLSLIVYDKGFGGYSSQSALINPEKALSLDKIHQEQLNILETQIQEKFTPEKLSPPLQLFSEAAEKLGINPVHTIVQVLNLWNRSGHLLFPEEYPLPLEFQEIIEAVDFKKISDIHLQILETLSTFYHLIETKFLDGHSILKILEEYRWPLLSEVQEMESDNPFLIFHRLTDQIIESEAYLEPPLPLSLGKKMRLLTAYLFANQIHPSEIFASLPHIEEDDSPPLIEAPLQRAYEILDPSKKIEDNRPLLTASLGEETFSLAFDSQGQQLKWPVLKGALLARFQPNIHTLPYIITLHKAEQINYPGTTQALSYSSDLTFEDKRTNEIDEASISMNHVYETKEGYRFYLSHIATPKTGGKKTVQLMVNYDPAKAYLTYPGGILLALGIFLLFFAHNRTSSFI